jgi:multiple sugar transport system ATP-binding protein
MRDVAMVFQSYALYPHMTVHENIAFPLKMIGLPAGEIARSVIEAASRVRIDHLLERKPGQLSGGQQQRCALARAIVRKPALFLLDEPLSNLDAKLRVQTRAEISKLHQRLGTTFIYVTHDQVEAMTMATRIAVMNLGVLQQVGTPQELYDNPVNLFVAGFMGSPAMNFFRMSVVAEGGDLFVQGPEVKLKIPADKAAKLRDHTGKELIIGVRPEDIHDAAYVPPGLQTEKIPATVDITELMGNEIFLYLTKADETFLARVDPRTDARPGQSMEVAVDMDQMHAFDPESELSLTSEGVEPPPPIPEDAPRPKAEAKSDVEEALASVQIMPPPTE